MKKKLPLLLASLATLIGVSGCNSGAKWTVGICQLVTHQALDAATQGFMDTLKKELGEENVKFDLQNAAGDSATCVTIANSFVSKNVSLIMANATPALVSAANSTKSIPILGTSVTDYGVALGIDNFDGVVGRNISGTSDCAPLDTQAEMLLDVFPDAEKVGLLYCSAEANSLFQVKEVEKVLQEAGIETTRYTFADSNEVQSVTNRAASESDVIYIPTDNTAAECAATIDAVCSSKNIPVFAGEEGLCAGCGAITLSISYYNIGVKTGKMAAEILRDGKDITKMAIAYDESPVKKFDRKRCEALGILVPSDYQPIGA